MRTETISKKYWVYLIYLLKNGSRHAGYPMYFMDKDKEIYSMNEVVEDV